MSRTFVFRVFLVAFLFTVFEGLSLAGDGAAPIEAYLNIRSSHGGSFSPDGNSIAFLSNVTGVNQVWSISTDGEEPRRLTNYEENISFAEYSPTRPEIVFGMDMGGDERTRLYLLSDVDGAVRKLTAGDKAIHKFGAWSHDGRSIAYASNARDERFFDVFVMDLESGKSRLVFQSDADNEAAAWSFDDHFLVVSTWDASFNNNLTLVDLSNLKHKLLTPHKGWATYTNIVWTPGKDRFYLVSNLRQEWAKLGRYQLSHHEIEYVDTAPWDTEAFAASADGRRIVYSLNVNGYSHPYVVDVEGMSLLGEIGADGGVVSDLRFSRDGSKLLYTRESPVAPPDLWIYDPASKSSRQITHSDLAGISRESFVRPEFLRYSTFDKLKIPAYFYRPAGELKGDAIPLLIYAHGGPEAQFRPVFSGFFQYLLSRNVAILAPNVRGSSGYGKTYSHLDDIRRRPASLVDFVEAVNFARTLKGFSGGRAGIYGGSYGGYVVMESLAEFPDVFSCGVSVAGVSNFATFLEKTASWRRALREAEYGSLANDRDFLESISPLAKADRIRTPLLLISGANDPRVPRSEADQMVTELQMKMPETKMLVYEDEGHGLSKLKNRLDAYPRIAEFLLANLNIARADSPNDSNGSGKSGPENGKAPTN